MGDWKYPDLMKELGLLPDGIENERELMDMLEKEAEEKERREADEEKE